MACKNLTSSINGKISNFRSINLLAEILKRVPSNQLIQFFDFRVMTHHYQSRVDKFPEKLPKIDWEYYRTNVRKEYIKMVDDFEKKYEELNKIFDNRGQVDTTMYFKEVDKVKSEVKVDIEKYIKESNERIKLYEQEIERLRKMIPYQQMTCEDFCVLFPEDAHYLGVGESFWPHKPEDQLGYVEPDPGLNKEESNLEADTAVAKQSADAQQQTDKQITAEAPQPSPTPSKENPGDTANTTPKPKTAEVTKPETAEVTKPSPAKEKPDPKQVTPPRPKAAGEPQPAPTEQKPSTTSKEAEKKPSTKQKESDKKDDPKNDGEKK